MPDKTVEVFNLGITSIASFAVAQVVKDALALEPDLVVVYTGHNEFYGIYGAEESARYNELDYSLRQLHRAFGAERAGPIGEERDARYGPTEAHGGTRRGALG